MTIRPPVPQVIADQATLVQGVDYFRRSPYGDWSRLMYLAPTDNFVWYELGNGSIVPELLERIYELERRSEFEVNT